ncbi:glycosyltransferase [Pandoraea apista]|uniref:glycosyltransferase n=1 Tax=Pandoraea apista TaxID=93218 RepID=UPI001EE5A4D4|nr:glycosyltransferase [Pandoraea apista]
MTKLRPNWGDRNQGFVMSVSKRPLVTFVVPAFNVPPDVLKESFQSIRAQTFEGFECIVVDESTDAGLAQACRLACAEDPRFIYVKPAQRIGLAGSLNLGIEKANGEWIARFDSDDICLPHRLEAQIAFLQQHPDVDILGGGLEIMNNEGITFATRRYPATHGEITKAMQLTTGIAHPTAMYRRSVVQNVGGYDPAFRFAEDLELWLRLMNVGARFANLQSTLVRYRQENVRRHRNHWKFNFRARTKNFSTSFLIRRMLGIAAVGAWTVIPARAQETIMKALLLRRTKR